MAQSAAAMQRIIARTVPLTLLLMNVLRPVQADDLDTRQPSQDQDHVLNRFMDELVDVAPGEGTFPESTQTPTAKLRPGQSFRISRYETTQELYLTVIGSNPSRWKGPRNSVETVSRLDVDRFCARLTAILRKREQLKPSEVVRLPTAVEWEYCCRAGSADPFCFGTLAEATEQLDRYAWHTGNAAGNDPAVGVLEPNAFGLYDVHGYLWEFVDVPQESRPAGQPLSWVMGGSWRDRSDLLTADSRIPVPEYASSDAIGFRCVVSEPR